MDAATQPGRAALSERKDDLYETPACATEALLAFEGFPRHVWEPACGRGAISSVLARYGKVVSSTDLVDYGYGVAGVDFLMERRVPPVVPPLHAAAIITNPPFKLANEFARHALDVIRIPKLALLLRLAFLEGVGRSDILDDGRLARIYPFRNRLPMMHRDGWKGPRATSATPFAWFVWDQQHSGPATIQRITAIVEPAETGVGS